MFVRHAEHPKNISKNSPDRTRTRASATVFLSGVMVLTVSTFLVKMIGLFYKIPMLRYLGSVGMGYFNAAYEWYAMLCILSTAGLPIAVSMLIARVRSGSEDQNAKRRAIRRIERLSMRIFVVFGSLGTLLLYLGAPVIADLIDSPMTAGALRAVAPTMLFSCISSAYRGYFQGFQNMMPTAISQMIEAIGKLVFGIAFAHYATARSMDIPTIAAYAMLGLSLGVALASGYLALCRLCTHQEAQEKEKSTESECSIIEERRDSREKTSLLRQLVVIAVPITLSSAVLSVTKIVDMALILRRLQGIGYTTEQANSLYGIYTTMAVPIFNLIPSLLTSVSLALIPTLTAQIAQKDVLSQRQTLTASLRLTALLGLPASLALALYSRPVVTLLFHPSEEDLRYAAPMLTLLAVSVVFSGLITTTNAALQAFGYTRTPIWSMLIGALVKIISAYYLISVPSLHILGAPISTFLCNAVIVGINLSVMASGTQAFVGIKQTLLQPLWVTLPSVGLPAVAVSLLVARGWNEQLLFFAVVPVTLVLLGIISICMGVVEKNELLAIPPLSRILCRGGRRRVSEK